MMPSRSHLKRQARGRILGSPIGSKEFADEWIVKRIRNWESLVSRLAEVAAIDPQCDHACLTHSIQHRWAFVIRKCQFDRVRLNPMENAIRNTLLPKICGIPLISDSLRQVFSLPVGMGGLGVRDISVMHQL
ncbi:hypothetical protein GJ496_010000 [Pomphorhynchus laevis]|nr:hypothetical protein GJ496_010000 [Pomphorhynchus laevis]